MKEYVIISTLKRKKNETFGTSQRVLKEKKTTC